MTTNTMPASAASGGGLLAQLRAAEYAGSSVLHLWFFISLGVLLSVLGLLSYTLARSEKRQALLSLGVAVRRVGLVMKEVTRKGFHALGALVPMVYYAGQAIRSGGKPLIPRSTAATILGALAAAQVAVEILRVASPRFRAFYLERAGSMLRDREREGAVTAVTSYLVGCAIAVAAFPPLVAMGAILTLVLADAAGALVGVSFGRTRLHMFGSSKSLEGTLAVFATSAFVWMALLGATGSGPVEFVAIAGAVAGALAELCPMAFDDNVTIPVVSGAAVCAAAWRVGVVLEGV